ncbi:MAG TPA: hypothetical protein VN807_05835 [Candidatus Sulfotelmatobacter sp.]|nr:hypothetical protein [Candidatus Sulfotelmatobacter sp.]
MTDYTSGAKRARGTNLAGIEALQHQRLATITNLAHLLTSFAAVLADAKVTEFAGDLLPSALREAEDLRIRRAAIADACQMSEATIARWAAGSVRPHPIVARAALEAICELALRNAKQLEDDAMAIKAGL